MAITARKKGIRGSAFIEEAHRRAGSHCDTSTRGSATGVSSSMPVVRLSALVVVLVLLSSSVVAQTVSVSVALQRPDPGPAVAGTQLQFNIFANNEGPGDAANVVLDTAVPAGSTFVSLSIPAGWLCPTLAPPGGTGAIQCTTPLLVPS